MSRVLSDTYWWLLYALAGAAVAWATLEIIIKHGSGDDLQDEVTTRLLAQHPGLKAFVLLLVWAVWPVVLVVALVEGVRSLYYGLRNRIDDLLDWWADRS